MKILLIEDEAKLAGFIVTGLKQAGHICDHVTDGATGLQNAMVNQYDLILLDLMLPSINGFDVLKNLKSLNNNTPVIILSALSNTENVITGLDLGAVDYLKKPFDLDELLARVRTAGRRANNYNGSILKIDGLTMDLLKRDVIRDGKKIDLSNREFALLEFLLNNVNKVVTKSQILERVWDMNFDPGSNVIEVHMYQLRKKVDKDFEEKLIHTVINRGYILKGQLTTV